MTPSTSRFGRSIKRFMQLEASGGMLLLVAAVGAMIFKNSPFGENYIAILQTTAEIRIGSFGLDKPLFLWINDGLMAVFFFLVGMEIKREAIEGYLADRRQIVLPAIAAVGGMMVPAMIYVLCNLSNPEGLSGWAIPTATDIAFALGVLALLGSRVPLTLKVFLMTLAVLDDLGAIVFIAVFYTSNLSISALSLAAFASMVLIILNIAGVRRTAPYILAGIILWVCVLESGVHATLAGVITGLAIPGKATKDGSIPPLRHLVHELHPWVAFAVLPIFAFANAGIALEGFNLERILSPVPIGILLGLMIGKPLGVFFFSYLAIKLKLAQLPSNVNWMQLFGVSALCGIGFTMSLFIGGLAFSDSNVGYARADRLAIIIASLLSGLLGYWILRVSSKKQISDAL